MNIASLFDWMISANGESKKQSSILFHFRIENEYQSLNSVCASGGSCDGVVRARSVFYLQFRNYDLLPTQTILLEFYKLESTPFDQYF